MELYTAEWYAFVFFLFSLLPIPITCERLHNKRGSVLFSGWLLLAAPHKPHTRSQCNANISRISIPLTPRYYSNSTWHITILQYYMTFTTNTCVLRTLWMSVWMNKCILWPTPPKKITWQCQWKWIETNCTFLLCCFFLKVYGLCPLIRLFHKPIPSSHFVVIFSSVGSFSTLITLPAFLIFKQ